MEWKEINNAPKGVNILVSGYNFDDPKEGRWVVEAAFECGGWYAANGDSLYQPTHWQPLPSLPEK